MTLDTSTTSSTTPPSKSTEPVTLLILGAGWTYQFLQRRLCDEKIAHAATTTSGRDDTIVFKFDPESDDREPFNRLPKAECVLVTFPLKGKGPSKKLLDMYETTHPGSSGTKWIQLGSTGIWTAATWNSASSPIDPANERGAAEDELISLGGCVLNLAGLYGGAREPRNWVARVAKTKEQLASKGALHLVHGVDVARAVVGVLKHKADAKNFFGRRWIVADCVSYDWWSLVWDWTGERHDNDDHPGRDQDEERLREKSKYGQWVWELMDENNVRGLPRSVEILGRKLDSREFWNAIGLLPEKTLGR